MKEVVKRLLPVLLLVFSTAIGAGTIDLSGGTYTGDVVYDVPHGQGTWTKTDGTKYVGEYKDGRKHGQGTYAVSDGAKYVGAWKDGKPSKGTESDKDGQILGTYLGDVRKATN